ncbi:MAG: hypothetical protein JXR13_13845 [Thalassovita sp.]
MTETEDNPRFRRAMYLMIMFLVLGYLGFKAWHLSMAFGAWEGQMIQGSLPGAAK